jgi:hypothetical protein
MSSHNNYKTYKEAKQRLVDKYITERELGRAKTDADKDIDMFVSINAFLAREKSQGPDADPGMIGYHFQHYENINLFVETLIENIDFNRVMCFPDYFVKYGPSYVVKNAVAYNITKKALIVPYDLIYAMEGCMVDKRFVYANFILFQEGVELGHANMLIFDLVKKTIERFEPHGGITFNPNMTKDINSIIKRHLSKVLNLDGFTYLEPIDISPVVGVQRKADAYTGMCVSYSMMYMQLRIMNPDHPPETAVNYLMSKSPDQTLDMILRYAQYIEDTLKKRSEHVANKLHFLYNYESVTEKNYIVINKNGHTEVTY